MVLEREMFRREHKTSQIVDVNLSPLPRVILAGTPNLDVQLEMRALAQSAAEMEDIGTASDQREVLSRMGKR